MTQEFFRTQSARLRVHFGERAFNSEFVQLAWREVHDMSETAFRRSVDVWIGSRTHNKPPLLSEFREARMAEEKLRFQNDVRGAVDGMARHSPEELRQHLRRLLSKEYGAVENVSEALEVAKHRLRVAKANKERA